MIIQAAHSNQGAFANRSFQSLASIEQAWQCRSFLGLGSYMCVCYHLQHGNLVGFPIELIACLKFDRMASLSTRSLRDKAVWVEE